jgi:hypothetical protein
MGKKSSSTAAVAAGGSKKLKRSAAADFDTPAIENWCHSKFVDKDLRKAAKDGLLKDDAAEARVAGPEITPTPPTGFRVMFLPSSCADYISLCMNSCTAFSSPMGFSCMI